MERCNEEIESVMEAHGIVDYFYVGVKLDGTRVSGFICGSDRPDTSVTERMQNLVGMIEANKQELIFGIIQQMYCGCGEDIDEDDIEELSEDFISEIEDLLDSDVKEDEDDKEGIE